MPSDTRVTPSSGPESTDRIIDHDEFDIYLPDPLNLTEDLLQRQKSERTEIKPFITRLIN